MHMLVRITIVVVQIIKIEGRTVGMAKAGAKGGTKMNGFKYTGLVSLIMVVANTCFALYEENNNGIYAEFAVLWFFMMLSMFVLDESSDRFH